jgi:hypothetical protein
MVVLHTRSIGIHLTISPVLEIPAPARTATKAKKKAPAEKIPEIERNYVKSSEKSENFTEFGWKRISIKKF